MQQFVVFPKYFLSLRRMVVVEEDKVLVFKFSLFFFGIAYLIAGYRTLRSNAGPPFPQCASYTHPHVGHIKQSKDCF